MPDRLAGALSRTSIRIFWPSRWFARGGSVLPPTWSGLSSPRRPKLRHPRRRAAPAAAPAAAPDDGSDVGFKLNGGGGKNIVKITNKTDNRLIVRGRVDFNRIPGDRVAPVNAAIAVASCVGCQTYAVGSRSTSTSGRRSSHRKTRGRGENAAAPLRHPSPQRSSTPFRSMTSRRSPRR